MLPRLRRPVLYACLLLALAGCSLLRPHFERPEISVVTVALRGGNLLHQEFAVKLHVDNPNDRSLSVEGVQADLSVEGEPVASGSSDRAFSVPARGTADFDVTVTANLLAAAARIANKMNRDAAGAALIGYEVTGAAQVDLPFSRNLPFHQAGSFSLNQH